MLDTAPMLSNTDRFKTHQRDPHLKRFRSVQTRTPKSDVGANKTFRVCRMSDRPSKLAHVNSAHLFMHRPPRPDWGRFSAAIGQYGACGSGRCWRTRRFPALKASGYSLGRSDRGGHEPEAGMD